MHSYATQGQTNAQLASSGAGLLTSADDLRVLNRYNAEAARKIDAYCMQWFAPRIQTRQYDRSGINRLYNTLSVYKPLLEITAVSFGDTVQTLTDFRLYLANDGHAYEIQRKWSSGQASWYDYVNSDDLIEIEGVWGYRHNYSEAWVDSLDSVQDAGGINASVTTITVTDADGDDANFRTPRFDVGQTIRIDDEYMIVRAVDTGANTLTVIRGARGSTTATHDNGASIDVWYPDDDIVRANVLIAAYNYNNRASFSRGSFDGQIVTTNLEMPDEAADILSRKRLRIVRGF